MKKIIIFLVIILCFLFLASYAVEEGKFDKKYKSHLGNPEVDLWVGYAKAIGRHEQLEGYFKLFPSYRSCMKWMKSDIEEGNGNEEPFGCLYKGKNKYLSLFMFIFVMEKKHFLCLLEVNNQEFIKTYGKFVSIFNNDGAINSCKNDENHKVIWSN
jgi:hypothetical protein